MKLPYKARTYMEVNYTDLEELICQSYDIEEFNAPLIFQWHNDSMQAVHASAGGLDEFEQEELDELRQLKDGNDIMSVSVYTIFKDLCNREIIEEGSYLIDVH